ncbi:hypothetical protein ACF09L_19260 [Streptomyces sp. NPDC014779]|uniref:hypothetical protein n=1 Tax=Streptomyces sp. NPDC014779 TaxID=3364911 RepID=UPI0036FDB308
MTAARSSWDDFKREVFGDRTEIIEGVEVKVPTDVPFGVAARMGDLSESSAQEDFEELVCALFGPEVFEQWMEAGMGQIGLMTVLTWGMAQAAGNDISFQEAYTAIVSGDPGKAMSPEAPAPNRAARRSRSGSTGGQSRRTSPASTGSKRTRSRA